MYLFFSQPLPESVLKRSEESFHKFLKLAIAIFSGTVCTNKVHSVPHLIQDCRSVGCHMDFNAVYDFESEQQQWAKNIIRSGTNILPQVK
jgi:hypothetical protein